MPPAGDFTVTVSNGDAGISVDLVVLDWSGTLAGVEPADGRQATVAPEPLQLGISQGGDDRSLVVAWTGGPCDERAQLEVAADARTLSLRFPPGPGCDAIGIGFAAELRFKDPVEPATFQGSLTTDLVQSAEIRPAVVAFADDRHGWVGGTSTAGDAVILETQDGGASWAAGGLGMGSVADLAAGGTVGHAAKVCPDGEKTCGAGRYRSDDGGWSGEAGDRPIALAYSGDVGAELLVLPGSPKTVTGETVPSLFVSDDGEVWTVYSNPCGRLALADVAVVDYFAFRVLCAGPAAGGAQEKAIYRIDPPGTAWVEVASTAAGSLSVAGAPAAFAMRADRTGWLWGAGMPLLATSSGGVSWKPLEVADGTTRMVISGSPLGDGSGYVLVSDLERQGTLLLYTPDGRSWEERSAWPALPECCG